MSSESEAPQHFAMPRLMGAPAYARPPRIVDETPRPLHHDDLPIEAERTAEDQELAASIPPDAGQWSSTPLGSRVVASEPDEGDTSDTGRPRSLGSLFGRRRS